MAKSSFFYWKFYRPLFLAAIRLFYFLPVKKNKIVFIQNDCGGFSCNLKYIALEILRQGLSYDMVWLLEDMNTEMPESIRKVKFNRIRAAYELATARFVLNNIKSKIYVKKKALQTFIYIPHGQSGAKKAENESEHLPDTYKKVSKAHSEMMDVFVTTCDYQTEDVRKYYWCKCKVWQTGFPRNDIFFKKDVKLEETIRQRYGLLPDDKLLLYTPTFRDIESGDAFAIRLDDTLDAMEHRFGGRWKALVTLHPNFKWYHKPTFAFSDRIISVSGCPDLQEIMAITDIMITDYSSTMMDFCLTRRPVFLFTTDLEEYQKMRGLKDLFFQLPFILCKSNDELLHAIDSFDNDDYQENLEKFLVMYGTVDDGHAAERFITKLKDLK